MRSRIIIIITIFSVFGFTLVQEQQALKVGEKAPSFSAIDHSGNNIVLDSLLKKGPVVLFFYRGSWCPYCNRQMAELQDSLHFITDKGASVIAVSPETNKSMEKIIKKSGASFTFISDTIYTIMNAYNVSFKVEDATLKKYKLVGIDIEESNGNSDHILPVPATYVIGKDGSIKLSYFNKDYKKRVSIKQIITALE